MRRARRSRTLAARPLKLAVEALERRGMMAADAGFVMSVEDAGPPGLELGVEPGMEPGMELGGEPGMEPGMEFVFFACDGDFPVAAFGIDAADMAGDVKPLGMTVMEPTLEPLAASMAVDVEPRAAAPTTGVGSLLAAWAVFAAEGTVSETPGVKRGPKPSRRG